MDRETALIVKDACEFYSRVLMGQVEEVAVQTLYAWPEIIKQDSFSSIRACAECYLKQAKSVLFPELDSSAYYGVGHNIKVDTSWNVYQTIRHGISWHDHPEGGWTVNFDKPRSWSGTPLPLLEIIDGSSSDIIQQDDSIDTEREEDNGVPT